MVKQLTAGASQLSAVAGWPRGDSQKIAEAARAKRTSRSSRARPAYRVALIGALVTLTCVCGCAKHDDRTIVTLWHQMTPGERKSLDEDIQSFQTLHPDIEVRALYKETEELRSGFETAARTPVCPQLVYMASDPMGAFQEMDIVQDMGPWFEESEINQFLPAAFTFLPDKKEPSVRRLLQVGDRIGNHLALVYNRDLIAVPPATTDEMVRLAVENTIDENGDQRMERYGLVWNFTEPFFAVPFLTGYGAWMFAEGTETTPDLDTPGAVKAYKFIASLRNKYKVIPPNCDYENADSLFKSGRAAMIINGDWSWNEYLANPKIDAAIACLPIVTETGLPMRPTVAPKGFSLSTLARGKQAEAAMTFVKYMLSEEVQRRHMHELKILPSRKSLLNDPFIQNDPTLAVSAEQMKRGRAMPVVPELRAVWDTMRPSYQALLGGSVTAEEAAATMQRQAVAKIAEMNEDIRPGMAAKFITIIGWLTIVAVAIWQVRTLRLIAGDWKLNRFAYLLAYPALIVIFATIVFPFFYNIVISFSNMSLKNFQDWEIIGFQHYARVFSDRSFLPVLGKTIIWTSVNVFFHVAIGLFLAVMLNGPVVGKSIYRVLLILPWAVPAYITALTWKGMFDLEYGAVNLLAGKYLHQPVIDWLGDPFNAFVACITTNVWLGFPFMMVIALGGMQGIPQELYEAARIDRVSRWMQFWHITLPMLRPVLIPAITLGTVWTFNNLNVIWLVSDGGKPSDKTHILVSYVYKAVFNLYRYGYGAALSLVIFGMLLVFSVVFLSRTNATEGTS